MTLLCGSCGHLYRSKPTRIPVGRACRFYDPRESKINRRQLKVKIVNPKRVACSNFTPTKNIFCELSKSDVQMDPLVCNHRRQNYDKYKGWNDCRKCGQFDKEVLPLFEEGYLKAPSKKIRHSHITALYPAVKAGNVFTLILFPNIKTNDSTFSRICVGVSFPTLIIIGVAAGRYGLFFFPLQTVHLLYFLGILSGSGNSSSSFTRLIEDFRSSLLHVPS